MHYNVLLGSRVPVDKIWKAMDDSLEGFTLLHAQTVTDTVSSRCKLQFNCEWSAARVWRRPAGAYFRAQWAYLNGKVIAITSTPHRSIQSRTCLHTWSIPAIQSLRWRLYQVGRVHPMLIMLIVCQLSHYIWSSVKPLVFIPNSYSGAFNMLMWLSLVGPVAGLSVPLDLIDWSLLIININLVVICDVWVSVSQGFLTRCCHRKIWLWSVDVDERPASDLSYACCHWMTLMLFLVVGLQMWFACPIIDWHALTLTSLMRILGESAFRQQIAQLTCPPVLMSLIDCLVLLTPTGDAVLTRTFPYLTVDVQVRAARREHIKKCVL